ncbi:hypothetical protein [Streptomyces hydrogenans]|uniref:hypothetical protein n=1 Tax=Streptomyces hydrogenans TaxID=1873719 RepID=UPI001CFDF85B|nr:hypothetical protein [Streptomyces hydrogenans]
MLVLLPFQPTAVVAAPGFWKSDPREAAAREAVRRGTGRGEGGIKQLARPAPDETAPWYGSRRRALLERRPAVDWLVVDRTDGFPAEAAEGALGEAAGNPAWKVMWEEAGIVLLTRIR